MFTFEDREEILEETKSEAERFLKKVDEYLIEMESEQLYTEHRYPNPSSKFAALKRASLDLSKQLVKIRQ